MRLASLREFRRIVYTPESAPALTTLRERIKAGKLPGGRIDCGRFVVDLDEYNRTTNLRLSICQRRAELENDPRLAGLI